MEEIKKMNKDELILAIQANCKETATKKEIANILASFQETVMQEVAKGNEIQLVGFGKFTSVVRAEREGRNPKNPAEVITIAESVSPKFKPGKLFKEIVKG